MRPERRPHATLSIAVVLALAIGSWFPSHAAAVDDPPDAGVPGATWVSREGIVTREGVSVVVGAPPPSADGASDSAAVDVDGDGVAETVLVSPGDLGAPGEAGADQR